jgi:hypothetical protein
VIPHILAVAVVGMLAAASRLGFDPVWAVLGMLGIIAVLAWPRTRTGKARQRG